jgi:triosephosphate isomerase
MRKKIVAGNWKMNLSIAEGAELVGDILSKLPSLSEEANVIFCCPFTHLDRVSDVIKKSGNPNIHLGAQNCNDKVSGAFTGEIAIGMLKETGVDSVIIGHSERRQYFGEDHEFLKRKTDALVAAGMHVLFCCGEPLTVREAKQQNIYVEKQLEESLFHLSSGEMKASITIAYEPIWAIGTGVTASTGQAQEMHAHIRTLLINKFGVETAQEISILYGGSCNAANAKELFSCHDVDGGLIGGAALKAETFLPIIESMG